MNMTFQEFFVDFERKNGVNLLLDAIEENIEEVHKAFVDKEGLEDLIEKLYYEELLRNSEYYYNLILRGNNMKHLYFKDSKGELRIVEYEEAFSLVQHQRAAKATIEREAGIKVGDGAILTYLAGKNTSRRGGGGGGGGSPTQMVA